jgi:hypothetical protein
LGVLSKSYCHCIVCRRFGALSEKRGLKKTTLFAGVFGHSAKKRVKHKKRLTGSGGCGGGVGMSRLANEALLNVGQSVHLGIGRSTLANVDLVKSHQLHTQR